MAPKPKTEGLKQETTGTDQIPAAVPKGDSIQNIVENMDLSSQVYLVPDQYAHVYKVAQGIAASDIIPSHYQKNPSNCFIALMRATDLGVSPFWFMEQTYVVHGKLGVQGKFKIALMNRSGIFKGRITFTYEGEGENRRCVATGVMKDSGLPVSMECSIALADKNGWNEDKTNRSTGEIILSKWKTIPDLMLAYRSASFLADVYCPDVIGGLTVIEESENFDNEPEQDKGPLFTDKPEESAQPEEVKPVEKEEEKPTGPPKTVDELGAFVLNVGITREQYNGYLFDKKVLKEGEDMKSLTPAALTKLCKNANLSTVDCKAWIKKNASD